MSKQIIVADDHPLFRSAISNLLKRLMQDVIIIEVDRFEALKQKLADNAASPSLVILDLKLPDINGLDGLLVLKKQYTELPVVIVSAYDEPKVIQQTKQYGANGFISKSLEMDDMARCISGILEGDICFPETIGTETNNAARDFKQLTPTQIKVLNLLKQGKPSKTMADILGVTEATIKAHLTTIFKKLGVRNRTQAVIAANDLDLPNTLPQGSLEN